VTPPPVTVAVKVTLVPYRTGEPSEVTTAVAVPPALTTWEMAALVEVV